jgi:predicted AlkP superfamily phosphohydrolase/phosphomutase
MMTPVRGPGQFRVTVAPDVSRAKGPSPSGRYNASMLSQPPFRTSSPQVPVRPGKPGRGALRRWWGPAILLLAGGAAILAGCPRGEEGSVAGASGAARLGVAVNRGRVVLFGIDGGDWRVIDPLMAKGRMPNMARMVNEGASGILLSMEPSASPSLWTTIATGVGPDRHGIHGFVVSGEPESPGARRSGPEEESASPAADVRPVTSGMRRAPAFWNILGRFDRRSGVVGWLVTWPAEAVDGFMVSSYLPYIYNWSTGRPLKGTIIEGVPHQTYPEGLIDELEPLKVRPADLDADLLRRFYDPDRLGGLRPEDQECVTGFEWSLACDQTYRRIGRHLFARYPVDLFAVYFGGVDVASHRFWKFAHPDALDYGVRPADAAVLGGVIDAYYSYLDGILGEYLDDLGPSDTLIVLSDHGFKPVIFPGKPTTSGHHRLEGILAMRGRGVRAGGRIEGARLVDILPTLLVLLDVPLAKTLEGHPIESALDPAFLRDHEPRTVPDYGGAGDAGAPDTSDLDRNVLERLRSLGYIN